MMGKGKKCDMDNTDYDYPTLIHSPCSAAVINKPMPLMNATTHVTMTEMQINCCKKMMADDRMGKIGNMGMLKGWVR